MAAIQSFLLSCCSSAANMGPSAVEATHPGSVALHDTAERSAEAIINPSHIHFGFPTSSSVCSADAGTVGNMQQIQLSNYKSSFRMSVWYPKQSVPDPTAGMVFY